MAGRLVTIVLCGAVAAVGCATKSYVQEQVTAAETKLTQKVTAAESSLGNRADSQETKLREIDERGGESRQAIDAAGGRLQSLDTRVTEVDALATDARARADQATDAEARLAQRLAGRNRYRVLDTKAVHFDSGRIDLRQQDVATLDEVAKALAADPNAVLELQGFADTRGSDRYNRELARERVEVVMRYLMQQHNIELRQLYGIPMGKVVLPAGAKATPDAMAEARRVDLRLLTPWSSWEESAGLGGNPVQAPSTSGAALPVAEAPSALPAQAQDSEARSASGFDSPARRRLPAFLRTITPRDLGGD
jgi:outer membrane protein OmpA-like peptidoglycan-associated protein